MTHKPADKPTETRTETPLDKQSRRGFLALAGAGAAGAAGAAVLAGAGSAGAAATKQTSVPKQATEPLIAYVRDAHAGEVSVFVGEREVVVHDRELAARIARAAY